MAKTAKATPEEADVVVLVDAVPLLMEMPDPVDVTLDRKMLALELTSGTDGAGAPTSEGAASTMMAAVSSSATTASI